MGLSLGAMGIFSFRNPFADLVAIVLGKGDLRSMLCLIVFLIVSLVLAYLTNPSENSFRAYLTEQSFRLHLSRLDENADDSHATHNFRSRYSSRNSAASTSSLFAAETSPFHFANRASIALRTPKHVFHSFAIFTIAAMVPLSKASDGDVRDGWMISDSWYIGAFGKWWRGGVLEAWYQDVIARSKDEESWSSGILSMKRLDMLQDYNGPTFSAKSLPSHLMRGSPPRLRNRERTAIRPSAIQPRSSTPPPLPKSASLPMHTTRKTSSTADRICDRSSLNQSQSHTQPCLPNDSIRRGPSTPSRSSSGLFEHSPLIAEVLRQITTSKASVLDLRTQLLECESAASHSRAVLQHEVNTHRERKRQEDASKLELKARTKSLEDSKRGAESMKRDAEKKLKTMQVFRDGATQRMDFLDKEIVELQQHLSDDGQFIIHHQSQISEEERDINQHLEEKRLQIKAAEDILLVLNQRSRELEEQLTSEKDKLQLLRGESDSLKRNRALSHDYPVQEPWPSTSHTAGNHSSALATMQIGEEGWDSSFLPLTSRKSSSVYNITQMSQDDIMAQVIALRNGLVTQNQNSSFQGPVVPLGDLRSMPSAGYPISDRSLLENSDTSLSCLPMAADLSNGLSLPTDNMGSISRSFQSDSDPYVDRDRRYPQVSYPSHYQNDELDSRFPASPTSLHGHSNNIEPHPFNTQFLSTQDYIRNRQPFAPTMDLQSSTWRPTDSDTNSIQERSFERAPQTKRWFPGFNKDKSTKGLNPDAKEFNLFRKPSANVFSSSHPRLPSNTGYDALNPNGLGSRTSTSTSSTNQSLLRAFAPSPAEREALQRALGGSTNTSFERLASLSDVGSIPASPTNAHALPHHPGRDLGSLLPAWLQTLPRSRKVNFSPWEDEEPSKESNGRRS
ncbi:hypothetical protein GALMADRAFT_227081 [Galerina marginata CBS 339.88]|uniref:Uncharacterized protein n=1 Tax=Galerina marginata (strain CBS 339.88) TaxID=685588 RepID=A0A067T906_GALM3|nr:hypothetical protein GALMADRAFT_227081 [Galerina marginata CBS 339.88]